MGELHPRASGPRWLRWGEDIHSRILSQTGWQRAATAAAAGLLSNLAFAPVFAWPVLFLTLPVLVWSIDAAGAGLTGAKRAFASGWWFGFGFFFAGLFWIGEAFLVEADKFGWALPFAVTLMPAGLALFYGAASAAAHVIRSDGFGRVLGLALALLTVEYLRGTVLTGFPWNTLGYAITAPGVLMQSAGLCGIYALSAWVVVIFASPLVLAFDRSSPHQLRGLMAGGLIAALPLLGFAIYGSMQLSRDDMGALPGVRVRIVQPSIAQREKWIPENQGPIFQDHLKLSRTNESGEPDDLAGITHVIWPEAAMPFLPLEHPEALRAIADLLPPGVRLVSGGLRRESDGRGGVRAFNSLMVFDAEGRVETVYDKTHLVPFGEYLPMQPLLEAIGLRQLTRMRGGFTEGPEPRPLINMGTLQRVGALICYEAIFPGVGRKSEGRPDVLINITNDGWFGNTTGPRQHFHAARVRAVEEGVPVIRVANNGISAVIDPRGRIVEELELNVRGSFSADIPKSIGPSLYSSQGELISFVHALFLLGMLFAIRLRPI